MLTEMKPAGPGGPGDSTISDHEVTVEGRNCTRIELKNDYPSIVTLESSSGISEAVNEFSPEVSLKSINDSTPPGWAPDDNYHCHLHDLPEVDHVQCFLEMEDQPPPPLPSSSPPSTSSTSTSLPKLVISNQTLEVNSNLYKPEIDNNEKKMGDKMISGLDQFFTTSLSSSSSNQDLSNTTEIEIARILADFNEILNSEDPYGFSVDECQELIANSVEAFSELLIGGTDSDLLIVVDEDETSESIYQEPKTNDSGHDREEDYYYEEGYESDLPMVRNSMRRMRPVHMSPIPSTSSASTTVNGTSVVPESSQSPKTIMNPGYPRFQPTSLTPVPAGLELQPSQTEVPLESNEGQSGGHGSSNATVVESTATRSSAPRSNVSSTYMASPVSGTSTSGGLGVFGRSRSPARESGTDGCATFRPSMDLVFTNLHIMPPDLTEALAETTENSESNTPGGTAAQATTNSHQRQTPNSTLPGSASRTTGRWPHRLSSVLALIGCTLGLTNICRFGSLSIEYGGNFTLQFTILSIAFGIPLFLFHMSVGQYMNSGIVDMWKISPIFQGIGIGLVISQAMIGIYTAVGVSWMFIYFRDSFIPRYDQYRWGKCFRDYRPCDQNLYNNSQLSETVPDYFNGIVLQRSTPQFPSSTYIPSGLKFTVAFNLAVVWMLVFVSLSKGLKSYGKVIHGFILVPITAMLVLSSKMVGLVPSEDAVLLFGQTSWEDFFFNTQTWIIAAREAFFTWGLFGACVMQITAHNRPSHSLKSDATIIVLVTTFVLLLTSFLANACYYVLVAHGYEYIPSSFESEQSFRFLVRKTTETTPGPFPAYLTNQHTSFLMGIRVTKTELGDLMDESNLNSNMVSGYQALRMATELFPTTMALLGSQGLSPFWTVLFYFTFILFGLAQQLAIWYTVIKGVIAIKPKILKSWEITISFSICAVGFVLGLPLCTEYGIFVEYFLDYTIGSGWWIMVLYLLELVAVFNVRGAPYAGENIVTVLFKSGNRLSAIFAPILAFAWNVILPVAVLILSISSFKSVNVRELYDWTGSGGYLFWPGWTRELGSLIQLLPLLAVPVVAIIQSCRYLSSGPPDLFDRIQLLYRPHARGSPTGLSGAAPEFSSAGSTQARPEDPPPKYTPPPSYSAITGAKITKFLRNSIRRSLRRISSPSTSNSFENLPPPPNYASVIVEMNGSRELASTSGGEFSGSKRQNLLPILFTTPPEDSAGESGKRRFEINITQNSQGRARTLERTGNISSKNPDGEDMEAQGIPEKISLRRIASDITPSEVARILRASFRRDTSPQHPTTSASSPAFPESQNLSSSDFTYRSTHDKDIDSLSIINQTTVSSNGSSSSGSIGPECLSSLPWNHNFDFSSRRCRNRRSNDSQLGLLENQRSPTITPTSETNSSVSNHRNLGIVNPGFGNTTSAGDSEPGGHLRSHSLTVPIFSLCPPTPSQSTQVASSRHHYHRTN